MSRWHPSSLAVLAASIALLGLAACSSDKPAAAPRPVDMFGAHPTVTASGHVAVVQPAAGEGEDAAQQPGGPAGKRAAPRSGPAIEVTWEALARERYLQENSRFRRPNQPQVPQKITLLNASHPDAARARAARARGDDRSFAHTTVLSDHDMQAFLQGLRQRGFFKVARPSGYDSALAQSQNARGRIIVTQGDQSVTLLSMRGQGLNPKTRAIPGIYSEAKQAIMVLNNMTPSLHVTHFSRSGTAPTR
jgi:hypothetical protein